MLVWLFGSVAASGGAGSNTVPWRVWSISRDSMDYLFTSATGGASGSPTLAFNHRSGRTSFLQVGEMLASWTIVDYLPHKPPELKPERVILASPEGERRTLERGQLYPLAGRRAWLVNLRTGARRDVRVGDAVATTQGAARVASIVPVAVQLELAGKPVTLSVISEQEGAALRRRADEAAAAATREQARLARVEAQRKVDDALLHPVVAPRPVADLPRQATPASQSQFFFGTDGPIPVEYTVLPPLFSRSGRLIRGAIVVPTRFETGPVCGFGNGPALRRRLPTVRIGR